MKEKKNKKKIIVLALLLLSMISIGYSFLSSNIHLLGKIGIAKNNWNIYYDNINILSGSVKNSDIKIEDNKINYNVELTMPGDYYEFTFDIVNDGTISAQIDEINIEELDSSLQNIIDYKVSYLDGTTINKYDILENKKRETILVKLKYKEDITNEELISTDQEINLSISLDYIQKDKRGNYRNNNYLYNIIANSNLGTTNQKLLTESESGIYKLDITENEKYPVFFNHGTVYNNYLAFEGYCWRIIRTTDTGSTKIIYYGPQEVDGTCSTTGAHISLSNYSSTNSNENYLKYVISETEESAAKQKLEKWYEENLLSVDDYIEDSGYCNDMSKTNDVFNTVIRNENNEVALTCSKEDTYTVSDSIGNGKLKYKVGLITSDELKLAGNNSTLFGIKSKYLTMSPSEFLKVFVASGTNKLTTNSITDPNVSLLPVITLKNEVKISNGNGLISNPYLVEKV